MAEVNMFYQNMLEFICLCHISMVKEHWSVMPGSLLDSN